jgi:hypothetical protein
MKDVNNPFYGKRFSLPERADADPISATYPDSSSTSSTMLPKTALMLEQPMGNTTADRSRLTGRKAAAKNRASESARFLHPS